MSCVAFVMHGADKRRARLGRRRIPEATLHLVEVAGGWLGAWLAMRIFRHKTQKTSYRVVFAVMVVLNVGLVILWVRGIR